MKSISLYAMSALYIAAGVLHLLHPQTYLRIMPPWLPAPLMLVWLSGSCEVIFGALLLPQTTRAVAAWLIIALLIAVFPANVQMAINWNRAHHPLTWIGWLRLPLQGVLIRWVWTHTKK